VFRLLVIYFIFRIKVQCKEVNWAHHYTCGQDPWEDTIQPHVKYHHILPARDRDHTGTSLLTHLLLSHRYYSDTCDPPTEWPPTSNTARHLNPGRWPHRVICISAIPRHTPSRISEAMDFTSFFYVYCHTAQMMRSQHLTTHFYRLYWPPTASNRRTWASE